MVEGKLKNGFEFAIREERLDDYEMFEKLCAIDRNPDNISMIIEVFKALLGDEQYTALKESMRNEEGHISTNGMIEALHEILGSENEEIKNS